MDVPPVDATLGPVSNPLGVPKLFRADSYILNPEHLIQPVVFQEAFFVDTPIVNGMHIHIVKFRKKGIPIQNTEWLLNDRTFQPAIVYASTAGPFAWLQVAGGSGASAKAIVTNGTITGITITNGGLGYTTAPNVTIFDAPAHTPAGSGASAQASIDPSIGGVV